MGNFEFRALRERVVLSELMVYVSRLLNIPNFSSVVSVTFEMVLLGYLH